MAKNNLRTYHISVEFYHALVPMKLPSHLRQQLLRAASSVALNLSEGSARPTTKDRARFYHIALASFRECEAVLDLAAAKTPSLEQLSDQLGAHLYKLCKACL